MSLFVIKSVVNDHSWIFGSYIRRVCDPLHKLSKSVPNVRIDTLVCDTDHDFLPTRRHRIFRKEPFANIRINGIGMQGVGPRTTDIPTHSA